MQTTLFFNPDGTVTAVHNDALPLDGIGTIELQRASHVWPCHPWKRRAFRLLRSFIGERGSIAEWCRTWRGPWEVRFADNPNRVVFSHPSRRVCIAWEIERLNERLAKDL